mgnify:CR=1 FL=1
MLSLIAVHRIGVYQGSGGKCEIETTRRISPAMTVVCYDPDHLRCDTTYTYREP